MPKGTLYMSLVSKRLVGIVASTALLSLFAQTANAQGTWYTDKALWQSVVTNATNAVYSGSLGIKASPYLVNGVTATAAGGFNHQASKVTTRDVNKSIQFTFSGNAFSGEFGIYTGGVLSAVSTSFGIVGTGISQTLTTSASGFTFLGYISDSTSPITVRYINTNSGGQASLTRFSFGNVTNPANPGSNVAPEPGSFALALTGGIALIGICIRRRRNAG